MAGEQKNTPLIGGLTFLGSTVFQIALGLVLQGLDSDAGDDSLLTWVDRHPWWALSVLLLVSTVLTSVMLWFVSRHHSDASSPEELIDGAARDLAADLLEQLEYEAQLRQLDSPRAIPIRWENADDALIDQWSDIRRSPSTEAPLDLAGAGDEIVEVFWRVPSHRLVVLGQAGAGKSVLMVRFMRSLLAAPEESLERIPVLLALSTWDPASTSFEVWSARELAVQHPSLGQRLPDGRTLATGLIEAGRLIYVLDGLDEMPSGLRAEAITSLSRSLEPESAVLLSCRLAEYRTAVATSGPLVGAAAVVVQDLRPSDVRAYLPFTTGNARQSPWAEVLNSLDDAAPGTSRAALREVLRTPLMVNLARVAYQSPDSAPQDLLASDDPACIEVELLDHYVATALDPGPGRRAGLRRQLRRTERHLAQVAKYMADAETPYFRWWEVARSLDLRARVILGALAGLAALPICTVTLAVASSVLYGLPAAGLLEALTQAAVSALVPALIFAFLVTHHIHQGGVESGAGQLLPVRLRRTWRRSEEPRLPTRTTRQTLALAVRLGRLVAAVTGVVITGALVAPLVGHSQLLGVTEVAILLLFALLFTIGSFLIFTSAVWAALQISQLLEEPVKLSEIPSPVALVRSNRHVVLVEALFGGLAAAILAAIATVPAFFLVVLGDLAEGNGYSPMTSEQLAGFLHFVLWLSSGVAMLTILIMVFVLTAWGRFSMVRVYMSLTGRFPLRLMRFLSDARGQGIMRQTGPAFQFRHLKLRDRLAERSR